MVHLLAMAQFMYHHHLDVSEWEPLRGKRGLEHKLDYFSGIEIPTNKLTIRFIFFERHDVDVMLLHDGITNSGDALEEVFRESFIRAVERLDKVNMIVRLLPSSIDTLEAERHVG
jgi:hypothetical protein